MYGTTVLPNPFQVLVQCHSQCFQVVCMMPFHCNKMFREESFVGMFMSACLLYVAINIKKFWYACMMPSSKSADTCRYHVMKLNTGFFMICRCIQPHETGETSATSTADAYYHGTLSG